MITPEQLGAAPTGLYKSGADFTLLEALTDWFLVRNGPFTDNLYNANTILRATSTALNKANTEHGS